MINSNLSSNTPCLLDSTGTKETVLYCNVTGTKETVL